MRKLVLIIIAFVISFVALADLIDRFINLITGLVGGWIGVKGSFGLNQILGLFMYPFALLLGLPWEKHGLLLNKWLRRLLLMNL